MAMKREWKTDYEILVSSVDRTTWNSDDFYIVLSEVEVEVPVPTIDAQQLNLLEVNQLKASIQREHAQSHVRITAIEEKIQSLLCIEQLKE